MKRHLFVAVLVLALALVSAAARSDILLDQQGEVGLRTDFRLRFESDWDSRRANGSERPDRDRLRIRLRVELTWEPTEVVTLGLRARSGSQASQQSPHITIYDFDDNPTGDNDALLDKWYLRLEGEKVWAWVGRNSLPFWRPNELWWDDDATPAGIALGYDPLDEDGAKLSLVGGYLAAPDGGSDFGPEMAGLQVIYATSDGAPDFTVAGGFYSLDGTSEIEHLRRGNGSRDYALWVGSFQTRLDAGERPLRLGLDLMHNSESYSASDPDPFTAANFDQVDGWDAYVLWGNLSEKGDWLAGLWYASIETFAVNASFAQDDWVRWGSPFQTDSSDLEGFELRGAYRLSQRMNLVARLYLVDAITSVQDGKRFRIDYNVRF